MLTVLLALACASEPPTPAAQPTTPAADAPAPQAGAAAPTTGAPASGTPATPGAPGSGEPAPGFPPESPEGQALAKAQAAGQAYGGALKGELQAAIQAGGPPNGITVCTEAAPRIAAQVREEQGVSIGRSSLKLRNPANQGPDWVQQWLQGHATAKAADVQPAAFIADVEGGRVARFTAPVAVEAVCVNCHGAADALSPDVKASLAANYPADQATGYAEGDLRGVLWVEVPVTGTDPAAASPGGAPPPAGAPPAPSAGG